MIVVVHDATALIDLVAGRCLKAWLATGIETHTTSLVILEIEHDLEQHLSGGRLLVKDFGENEIIALLEFKESQPAGLSLEDCSVFYHAKRLGAVLVTGDRTLKEAAQRDRLEVHGTLWLLDEMVTRGALTPAQAIDALQRIMQANARLPVLECEARLKIWSRKPL